VNANITPCANGADDQVGGFFENDEVAGRHRAVSSGDTIMELLPSYRNFVEGIVAYLGCK
jgi:hypothetical protein